MTKRNIAKILLENKAVTLNAKEPYTYASGIRSPIYCDNRLLLENVEGRKTIVKDFIKELKKLDYDVIAGTSTAGIPWAAWLAQKLKKPMCYIRGGKKEHGKGKQIEGAQIDGKKVVVIEDLISTGGSSFSAVEAARETGAKVVAVVAIFTYEFGKAREKFEEGNCDIVVLTDFSTLIRVAKSMEYISQMELKMVKEWNKNPAEWGPKYGFPNKE